MWLNTAQNVFHCRFSSIFFFSLFFKFCFQREIITTTITTTIIVIISTTITVRIRTIITTIIMQWNSCRRDSNKVSFHRKINNHRRRHLTRSDHQSIVYSTKQRIPIARTRNCQYHSNLVQLVHRRWKRPAALAPPTIQQMLIRQMQTIKCPLM